MKTRFKTALFSLLLTGSLWQTAAYADTHASDSSKTQPVEPWHPHSYRIKTDRPNNANRGGQQ